MKENAIKTLSAACIMMICFTPNVQEASEFNLVEDNDIKTEDVKESCSFYFVPCRSIGIKTAR